jgi:hypothetical protein
MPTLLKAFQRRPFTVFFAQQPSDIILSAMIVGSSLIDFWE